jgi:hypothetical protein
VVAQADDELELTTLATELELTTELFDELEVVATELELGAELLDELELTTELFELDEEVVATELLLVTTAEQTAPVMVGFSAAAELFLSPCTPKLTD